MAREDQEADEDFPVPFVLEGSTFKALHFSISATQSRMSIDDPDALDLAYTRTMLGFLAFVPEPRRILMIGLGGGSLPKYCHRKLPRAEICVVEINPHVIALRDEFSVPRDGDRFEVIQADGAQVVRGRHASEDVLVVDGFDREGQVRQLATTRFYESAWRALRPGGVMVVNLHLDPLRDRGGHYAARRIEAVFGPQLIGLDEPNGANRIVFARKCSDAPARIEPRAAADGTALDPWLDQVLARVRGAWNDFAAGARPAPRNGFNIGESTPPTRL